METTQGNGNVDVQNTRDIVFVSFDQLACIVDAGFNLTLIRSS